MPGQDAAHDSWHSLLPDNDPLVLRASSRTSSTSPTSHAFQPPSPASGPAPHRDPIAPHPRPPAPRSSIASSASAVTSLSLAAAERRLSSTSQFSSRTMLSTRSQLSTMSSDSACSTAPIAESPENALGLDIEHEQARIAHDVHELDRDRDHTSSRSAPPNVFSRERHNAWWPAPESDYELARALGKAGTPQHQPTVPPKPSKRPSSTRSWNGQEGEPEYLVRHSPAPTTPFLERRPAPPETKLDVETHQNGYTIRLNLPGFDIDGISLSVKHHRTLHIVADNWDAETGGHFEPSVLFGADADLHAVRAQFDGSLLLINVPLKSARRAASAASNHSHRSSTVTTRSEPPASKTSSLAPTLAHPKPTMAQPPPSPVEGLSSQPLAQQHSTHTTTSSSGSDTSTTTTAPAKQSSPHPSSGATPVPSDGPSSASTESCPPTRRP